MAFIKFLLVSGIAGILQIILDDLLCWALADWKAPLPGFLTGIFSASVVGAGNDNWGYVFPFFASNLLANIYGYIQNKKTTFKSDAPAWCFAVYLALMVCLILFSTWLQGVIANALRSTGAELWSALAPTIAAAPRGHFRWPCSSQWRSSYCSRKRRNRKLKGRAAFLQHANAFI